jgi:single-stranded-DNA-specific exonuclease
MFKKRGKDAVLGFISDDMVRLSTNIKNGQDKERTRILEMIANNIDLNDPIIMAEMPEDVSRTFYGLIANKIANIYGRPAIVFSKNNHGTYSGSGREYSLSGIENFKDFLIESNLFLSAAGHQGAMGVIFSLDKLEEIKDYFRKTLDNSREKIYHVDFELTEKEFTTSLIKELTEFIPLYGQNFDEPFIHVKELNINCDQVIVNEAKSTLKYIHKNITYCMFYPSDETITELTQEGKSLKLNLVGKASINDYNNVKTPQLIVDSYEIVCYNTSIDNNEEDISWF